jgi:hypothetical protein
MNNLLDRMWSLTGAVLLAGSIGALWVWPKFFGVDTHPLYAWAEVQTGVGWLEPGLRYVVAGAALVIAMMVLFPRTRLLGAYAGLALALLFLGAHFTPLLGMNIPEYGPLMEAMAAGHTAEEIRALGLPTDKGGHASLAILNATLALITIGGEAAVRKAERQSDQRGIFAAAAA